MRLITCKPAEDVMDYLRVIEKRRAVKDAEQSGAVADSMDVRMALMARVHAGEITLEEAQAELKRVKRGAKARGMVTRAQAFRSA